MKVKTSSLNEKGDTLLFRDTPFTGVAYDVQDNGSIAGCRNVIHGKILGLHRHWGEGLPLFDLNKIQDVIEDDIIAFVGGKPFTGIICEFIDGMLVAEEFFLDGRGAKTELTCMKRTFWQNGFLDRIARGEEDQYDEWWENGIPNIVQTTPIRKGLRLAYNDSFQLHYLCLDEIVPEILHGNFQLILGNKLTLRGPFVVDELMVCLNGLLGIKEVALEETGLTSHGIRAFLACENLESLTTRRNTNLESSAVQSLVSHHPNCQWNDW